MLLYFGLNFDVLDSRRVLVGTLGHPKCWDPIKIAEQHIPNPLFGHIVFCKQGERCYTLSEGVLGGDSWQAAKYVGIHSQ